MRFLEIKFVKTTKCMMAETKQEGREGRGGLVYPFSELLADMVLAKHVLIDLLAHASNNESLGERERPASREHQEEAEAGEKTVIVLSSLVPGKMAWLGTGSSAFASATASATAGT
jgi:hypothetical protein